MKHYAVAALAAVLISTTAGAAEIKIGSINTTEILQQAPQFQAAQQKMKTEFAKRGSELQAQEKQLAEDMKDYQRNASIMSADDREKKEKDLRTREIDLQYAEQKFKQDVAKRNAELNQQLEAQVRSVILAVAKAKGLDLIVGDPLYAAPSVDVTSAVLKQLKAQAASGK